MSNRPTPSFDERPWSRPVLVAEVPETGVHVDMVADDATRAEIARLAGLRNLPRLMASLDVSRHGRDGLRVMGKVSAMVGQTCVVTLEPIDSEVEEAIDLTFAPREPGFDTADGEEEVAFDADQTPDPLTNGVVDLGAVVTEFLLLGLDPYPRKPGAVFEPPAVPDDPAAHPFAVLAALKNRSQPDEK